VRLCVCVCVCVCVELKLSGSGSGKVDKEKPGSRTQPTAQNRGQGRVKVLSRVILFVGSHLKKKKRNKMLERKNVKVKTKNDTVVSKMLEKRNVFYTTIFLSNPKSFSAFCC